MGMFDTLYPEGAARCIRGHVLEELQTKSLQDWPSLARFAIRDGQLVCTDHRHGPVNFSPQLDDVVVYSSCDRCPNPENSAGQWTEWTLVFDAELHLVEARPNPNALPWGYPDPDVELAEAVAELRPHGISKVLIAVDQLLGGS